MPALCTDDDLICFQLLAHPLHCLCHGLSHHSWPILCIAHVTGRLITTRPFLASLLGVRMSWAVSSFRAHPLGSSSCDCPCPRPTYSTPYVSSASCVVSWFEHSMGGLPFGPATPLCQYLQWLFSQGELFSVLPTPSECPFCRFIQPLTAADTATDKAYG